MAREAYVASISNSNVTAIDIATHEVVGSPIQVGVRPRAIAITPDGSKVYTPNNNSYPGAISVVDTDTGIVKHIGGPLQFPDPVDIAITPDGSRAYVTYGPDDGAGSVLVINTATDTLIGDPIEVGTGPWGIAIAPDGSRAYVANKESGTISVIDTATNTVETTIGTIPFPYKIAMTPDGSSVYVTSFFYGTISVIDTDTNQINDIDVEPCPTDIAVTPDGSRAYVATTLFDRLSIVDTGTNTMTSTVGDWGDFSHPIDMAITPDGSRGFVTEWNSGTISVFNAKTNEVVGKQPQTPGLTFRLSLTQRAGIQARWLPSSGTVGRREP